MRIFLSIVFFLIVFCIALYFFNKEKDIFSPMIVYCFLVSVHYLPGLLYIEKCTYVEITEKMVLLVFFYEIIAVLCTVIGYCIFKRSNHQVIGYEIIYRNKIPMHLLAIVLYLLGFIAGVVYLMINGGISIILSGIKGIHAGNGNSYIRALMFLMVLGMCLYISDRAKRGLKTISVELIVMYLFYSFFFVVQTSRSPVLEALMILIMTYHYCVKKIKIKNIIRPRNLLILYICIIFIVIMPSFRTTKGFSEFVFSDALKNGTRSANKVFDELCYTARDGFIYQNYSFVERWHGKNIVNLFLAPIPSALYSRKPPVDDGMYLANAMVGYFIKPPQGNLPWYNSVPLTTSGGLYIDFGLLGIIIGSIIFGYIYGIIYDRLVKSNYDVINVIYYQLIIYQLEFSSLSIVQTLTPAVLILIVMKCLGRKERIIKHGFSD